MALPGHGPARAARVPSAATLRMKVLLTGANGFVGSHILDQLRARRLPAVVLLRPGSSRRWIEASLEGVAVRLGSLADAASLGAALAGITHVIHCAGCVKALRAAEFYEVNQAGTRRLVEAVNAQGGRIERVVHLSSLAAAGPALPMSPAREESPPHPVSTYGQSKLGGERELQERCRTSYVILRPPAVYGPRDAEFLRLFRMAQGHVRPLVGGGRQALSLVFVRDLAAAVVACLDAPRAVGRTYYVASPEVVTVKALVDTIAAEIGRWTLPLWLPTFALWPACVLQEMVSRLTGRPSVLSRQKYAELRAPGWVCDPSRLEQELGLRCPTPLAQGIQETRDWYRHAGWL